MKRHIICFSIILSMITPWAAAAQVESVEIRSKSMKRKIAATIVIPDIQKAKPTHWFPTLYLLHCAGDDERAWIDRTPVCEMADTYGVIIVTPSAGTSWYFDSPVDEVSQFETFVAKELPSYTNSIVISS